MSFIEISFRACALAACVTLSTACVDDGAHAGRSLADAAEPSRSLPARVDDEGLAMPAVAMLVPTDPLAQTRDRRYASRVQADRLRSALGSRALTVELAYDDASAFDAVVGARDRGELDAVLITAADPRVGAAFADRLSTAGVGAVWLVTQ